MKILLALLISSYAGIAYSNQNINPFDDLSCQGPNLTAVEVRASVPTGEDSKNLGAYQVFTRTRTCNSFTGCGNWSEGKGESGSYSAKIIDSQGNVNINFTNECTFQLGSPTATCILKGYSGYAYSPTKVADTCVRFKGAYETQTAPNSPNYEQKEFVFYGQHSLRATGVAPIIEDRDLTIPLSCKGFYKRPRAYCSEGYYYSEENFANNLKFRITNGKFQLIKTDRLHLVSESNECVLNEHGSCKLSYTNTNTHESYFTVQADKNHVSVYMSQSRSGGYPYPTCNEFISSESCSGAALIFK